MKKMIFTASVVIIVFIIYFLNINNKINYLSLGDYLSCGINNFNSTKNGFTNNIKNHYKNNLGFYINYCNIDDYRVMDLINDINYNKEVKLKNKSYKIQNLLVKANYITISIGMNDLIYKKNISYKYVDSLLNDIDNLLKLIRKYNKDEIYFLSLYDNINNNDIIEYTNKKLLKICKKNEIKYVDISKLNSFVIDGLYPTNDGYNYITKQILNFTKN